VQREVLSSESARCRTRATDGPHTRDTEIQRPRAANDARTGCRHRGLSRIDRAGLCRDVWCGLQSADDAHAAIFVRNDLHAVQSIADAALGVAHRELVGGDLIGCYAAGDDDRFRWLRRRRLWHGRRRRPLCLANRRGRGEQQAANNATCFADVF